MPSYFPNLMERRIREFELREDDIWILSYPKSGTHWTQEMVWMITHDVDTEAGRVPLAARSPMIESRSVLRGIPVHDEEARDEAVRERLEAITNMPGRRLIKTHLPLELLPPRLLDTCQLVYVARNPRDCAVSFYHHNLSMPGHGFVGTFDQFLHMFEVAEYSFNPY